MEYWTFSVSEHLVHYTFHELLLNSKTYVFILIPLDWVFVLYILFVLQSRQSGYHQTIIFHI